MFLSNSGSKHKSHRQYGLMDKNMINNKFASQAIHVGTQDLTVYCKPKNFVRVPVEMHVFHISSIVC